MRTQPRVVAHTALTLRLVVAACLWSPVVPALAGPFSDAEVERRMAEGAELSCGCKIESKINQSIEGDNCAKFFIWTRDGFPAIESNLKNASPKATADLERYKTCLADVIKVAESQEATTAKPPQP
jgi:hypothetical protein